MQTFKLKGLDFYVINADDANHAVGALLLASVGVTTNNLELFEGTIPSDARVYDAADIFKQAFN